MRPCLIENCDNPANARDMCQTHYGRWRRHGSPHVRKYMRGNDAERFWSYVDKRGDDECWEWQGGRSGGGGYGQFFAKGRQEYAHRFAYELHHGSIEGELIVRHECDNPPCVNPRHLCLGTHQDNANDRVERGRSWSVSGEQHWNSKVSDDDVLVIFALRESGETQKSIATHFGISDVQVCRILSGNSRAQ